MEIQNTERKKKRTLEFPHGPQVDPKVASKIHQNALKHMMKECGFAGDNIPQMEDVSNYLKSKFA